MRVLITGAAGFLGSHLADRLVADGHRVVALDDLSTGRLANLKEAREHTGLYVHRFDITETDLRDVLVHEAPEVVCHLAARRSADPVGDARVNVGGTANLLQGCVAAGVERVIFASDATAVYAAASRPVSERAGIAPASAFGASKVAAEAYLESSGLPGVVLRLASLYGPRSRTGVVAHFARSLARATPGTVYGDGSVARDLLHVEDAVDAVLRCLGGKGDGRRLNIGTGIVTRVRELHTQLAALAGVPDAPSYAPGRQGESSWVGLDSGSARRALGWEPAVALADGLKETLDWHRVGLPDGLPPGKPHVC